MKKRILTVILAILTVVSSAQRLKELTQTKYFAFYSNQQLNAHLYLYNKAIGCKFQKKPSDSLAYYSFKDKFKLLSAEDAADLNKVVMYYRDSVVNKDLLFDGTMSSFCDELSTANGLNFKTNASWQQGAMGNIKKFLPYFNTMFWPAVDSANKAWLNANKVNIETLEKTLIPELEKIYKTKMPAKKIRVDLSSYATWAGAYSYKNKFEHIVFSSKHPGNQGDLAAEVVFHEASHFLVDMVNETITKLAKEKGVSKEISLWHNLIFYTTGFAMQQEYKKAGKEFVPYYVQSKLADRFPEFKYSIEACKEYWDNYIEGKAELEPTLTKMVDYVIEKSK